MKKNKAKLLFLILLFGLLFTSCITTQMRETVTVDDDGFSASIKILGIETAISDDYGNSIFAPNYFFLRSFVNRAGTIEPQHQIYIVRSYNFDWHFYNRASAEGGQDLEFISIDRDVDCGSYGCTYTEQMCVGIPDEMLKVNPGGFAVKVFSKSGNSFIVNVTRMQIAAQLKAIDDL